MNYTRNPKYKWYMPSAEWKYELLEPYSVQTPLRGCVGGDQWTRIDADGILYLGAGFKWDGASGPAIDTESFMRASAVHDALYQHISQGRIPIAEGRAVADKLLYELALADGMFNPRALWVYAAVRLLGRLYIKKP